MLHALWLLEITIRHGQAQTVRQSGTKSRLDAEKSGIDKIVQLTAREHSTILFAVVDREVQLPH